MEKMTGTIIRLLPSRGFGFALGTDGFTRFIHVRDMIDPRDFDRLYEGKGVKFIPIDMSNDPHATGNKMRATQVEII